MMMMMLLHCLSLCVCMYIPYPWFRQCVCVEQKSKGNFYRAAVDQNHLFLHLLTQHQRS